jgi:hypothetical protein
MRDGLRDAARSGLGALSIAPLNQALSNSSLTDPEKEAIRKAFEAALKTTPGVTPEGPRP